MKSIILASLLLAGVNAFAASRNCAPTVEMYGDVAVVTYPCSTTQFRNSCRNGEVQYFQIENNGEISEKPVVCTNGRFFARVTRVRHAGCNEGDYAYSNDTTVDGSPSITLICRGGEFVPANP